MKVEKLFDLVGSILLATVILFFVLLVMYFSLKVASAGVVVSLIVLAATLFLLWFYWKDVSPATSLRPGTRKGQKGRIQALIRVIERASRGYDVSREQVDTLITYVTGEDIHVEGKGEQYLKNLEEVLT